MKALGLFFLFAGSVSAGLVYCRQKKQKLLTLRELIYTLEHMEGQLRTNDLPLKELCAQMVHMSGRAVRPFYASLTRKLSQLGEISFAELWGQALAEELPGLDGVMRDPLLQLGNSLGRYELQQQLRALQACRSSLCAQLEEAKKAYPNQAKLGMGLSASVGILVWIILA